MIREIETLTNKLKNLEELLIQYDSLTNLLLSVNLEETAEIDVLFIKRGEIINNITVLRNEITMLINIQTEENAVNIRKMLSGQTSVSNASLSGEEKLLHGKIIDIRSLQIDILKKDEEIAFRFKLKREEIRSALADLQQEKKKINFYSNASINAKGQTFDSQN